MNQVFGSAYADVYDALYADKDYVAECDLVESIFRQYRDNSIHSVLDLGCGPAGIFIALTNNTVIGVDPLIEEYKKENLFFNWEDYPRAGFIKSTIEDFKPAMQYDFVFCMNAINHVRSPSH